MTNDPEKSRPVAMPKMYREFADWWPLISAPEDYAEEATFYREALEKATDNSLATVLELGSGGGNNASHMKSHFDMTLSDLSEGMLRMSRQLNPECDHHQGDMRSLRLDRAFDGVFIHDAIDYMTSLEDLESAFTTAFVHLRPGGAALFAPDHLRESFLPEVDCGGHDGETRALRYMEWTWDPDPNDSLYTSDYAYLLRMEDGSVEVEKDRHIGGLFSRGDWLRLLEKVGFEASAIPFQHSEVERELVVFLGRKREGSAS